MATIQLQPATGEPLDLDPNSGVVVLPPATQGTTAELIESQETSVVNLDQVKVTTLSNLSDVDSKTLNDGSVLVYKSASSKWTSTLHLEQQYMNGGFF